MRCPSCNKFPSFDIGDPESDLTVEGGQVQGSIRLVLNTACCGDEAKEANFEVDIDVTDEVADALQSAGVPMPESGYDFAAADFTIESEEVSADDRYQSTDRRGKPITKARYQKHFYCVHADLTIKCRYPHDGGHAEVSIEAEFSDEVQASGMDELA